MNAKVYFHGYISPSPNLVNIAEVSGNTVSQCLDHFVNLYPRIKKVLFDENGKVHEYFWIVVNTDSVSLEELTKPVKDGDELHIIPVIGGG